MQFEACIERIDRYFRNPKHEPRIINFNNIDDYNKFLDHYRTGNLHYIGPKDICNSDNIIHLENLYNMLNKEDGKVIVYDLSIELMLQGENSLKKFINNVLNLTVHASKVVYVFYKCDEYIPRNDVRKNRLIYSIDGAKDDELKITLSNNKSYLGDTYSDGINEISYTFSKTGQYNILVYTKYSKNDFPHSMIELNELNNPFTIISGIDDMTSIYLDESYGSNEEWEQSVTLLKKYKSWLSIFKDDLQIYTKDLMVILELAIKETDKFKKWLLFIALKLFAHESKYRYVMTAVNGADTLNGVVSHLWDDLLNYSYEASDYRDVYMERKTVLAKLGDTNKPFSKKYCKNVIQKEDKTLYYLTDLTKDESYCALKIINDYYDALDREEVVRTLDLTNHYLSSYLKPYDYHNGLMNNYFNEYKFEKVENHIKPEFLNLVNEEATERSYIGILQPRMSLLSNIDVDESTIVYFIDALGVEYLSYMMQKLNSYELHAFTYLSLCNLPSITLFNKDFNDYFKSKHAKLVNGETGIKYLDDIKHDGVGDYDYQNCKYPFHLIDELAVIDNELAKIKDSLDSGNYKQAIIVSDHGASRLAVINEHENKWEMSEKGQHGGRCAPRSDFDDQPDCAVEENEYWSLANYDRFKGGRKANVEVHGGATFEEVVVPIIVIDNRKRVYVITVKTKQIEYKPKFKTGKLKLFVNEKANSMSILYNDEFITGTTTDHQNFTFKLENLKNGKHHFDVYIDDTLVESHLTFEAVSKVGKERDLFGF